MSRRRLGRRAGALLALALVAAGLSGCAAARQELGTVNSDCYIALPAAFQAVHHHGRLEGVELVSVSSLRDRAPRLYAAARENGKTTGNVCLVAFAGRYRAASVGRPAGDASGRVAVVELGYPAKRLFATVVLARPPLGFGHFRV